MRKEKDTWFSVLIIYSIQRVSFLWCYTLISQLKAFHVSRLRHCVMFCSLVTPSLSERYREHSLKSLCIERFLLILIRRWDERTGICSQGSVWDHSRGDWVGEHVQLGIRLTQMLLFFYQLPLSCHCILLGPICCCIDGDGKVFCQTYES